MKIWPFVAFAVSLTSCSKPLPTVVIDAWWARDFSANSCKPDKCGATDDPGEVNEFLGSLRTAFVEETSCSGVHVVQFDGPNHTMQADYRATARPNETLIIDFDPHQSAQHFGIQGSPATGVDDTGTVGEIAKKTCNMVKGHGAAVE